MFNFPRKYWRQLSLKGKLLVIKDAIEDKIWPYKLERSIKDVYYGLKKIPFNVKKMIFFFPVLWRYQWWDFSFYLALQSRALEYNLKFYSDANKVHMQDRRAQLIVRQMILLKEAIDRLIINEYPDLHKVKRQRFSRRKDTPIIIRGLLWGYRWNNKMHDTDRKLIRANMKHETTLRKKDLRLIGKITEKHLLTFWD